MKPGGTCIHNTSASLLIVGFVWCCGSSLLYCLVSSSGGLSCKQLSKGNLLHSSFQKHISFFLGMCLFLWSSSWLSVSVSYPPPSPLFLFLHLHHTPTHTDVLSPTITGSGSVPVQSQECIGVLGASGEGRTLLACQCLWPLCHNGSLSPPTHFPAKLGRVNIYQPPQQWPARRRKRLWPELMQGL